MLMQQALNEKLPMNTYLPRVEVVTQLDSSGKHGTIWPQMDAKFLTAFLKQFPEAKLILHKRKPKDVVDSINNWKNLRTRIGLGPSPVDRTIELWVINHYKWIEKEFAGDRLIVFNLEDPKAPDILEENFGRVFPWWGKANVNKLKGRKDDHI